MRRVTTDGTTLQYEQGGERGPAIVFVPDAGFGPWLWGWQAPRLTGPYRTVVYAPRGTDGSEASGPYTIERFAADLEAVLAAADLRRVHVVGAGLGGMVALRYAREYGRARSLVLFGAAASGDAVDSEALSALQPGDRTRLRESLSQAFSASFLAETGLAEDVLRWRREEDATGDALAGHLAATRRFEAGPLYEVSLPVLVCHGVADPVVPPAAGRRLAETLPRGEFETVEGKRCCFLEHSAAVTDSLEGFLETVESAERDTPP